ncbi:ABC family transporter: mitochondrial ATM1-like protein [Ostreococcus tauri]|uniref:ABC family transporter: mitochondrial ATM1-like protein n=2 Tax=Ostreococcus tauri TaxID=70448 RepID=A0A1Y5ICU6_OSTTA|nr:ABC family transporter: mitochondrial ATM1-like protein [Ostreococcus tauri]
MDGAIPRPPRTSRLVDVLPYLFAVSLSRRGTSWRLFGAMTFLVIQKGFGLAVPILFKVAVDHCTAAAAVGGSAAVEAARAAAWALVASGCLKAMSGVATELRTVLFTPVAQASGRRVALEVFNHVLGLDLSFHLERRTGALQRIIDRGTRSVSMVFRAVVFTFLPTAIELALVCGLLWHAFSWHFVVVVLTTFVLYVWWTMHMTGVSAEKRKLANHMDGLSTGKAVDALLNYETVTFFGNIELESAQYDNLLRGYHEAALQSERASSLLNAGQAVILACGMTTILAFAALGIWKPDPAIGLASRVGDLVMANGLLLQLWAPLQFLGFFYRELRQSLVDMEAMFDIMSTESKIPDGAVELPESAGGAELELDDVSFAYGNGRDVLKGVSLKLKPGESVGIVGPSGSGKSTLLRLILRVYDVTSGKVKLDGHDVRELTLSSLRDSVAVIPQDTVLFNDTLEHNIRYGRPTASEEQVAMAATRARLDKTIEQMPNGRQTMVGERGVKLSGGEKQRVAIARAFLREPRMLVADEATSALDTATEQGILESLEDVARGRTAVFVAHRLSTVRSCDRIIVMEQGKIVEEGTHAELLDGRSRGSKIGMYAAMWKAQAQEEEENNQKPDDLVLTVG